jgi:hypothetical protein
MPGFCGTLRASIFLASGFSCSRTESTPADYPLTQTLGGSVQVFDLPFLD